MDEEVEPVLAAAGEENDVPHDAATKARPLRNLSEISRQSAVTATAELRLRRWRWPHVLMWLSLAEDKLLRLSSNFALPSSVRSCVLWSCKDCTVSETIDPREV